MWWCTKVDKYQVWQDLQSTFEKGQKLQSRLKTVPITGNTWRAVHLPAIMALTFGIGLESLWVRQKSDHVASFPAPTYISHINFKSCSWKMSCGIKRTEWMNNLCDIVLHLVVRRAPSFFFKIGPTKSWNQIKDCSKQYEITYQRVRMIKIYENVVLHSFYHSQVRKKYYLNCLIWMGGPQKRKWEWPQLLPTSPQRTNSTSAWEDHVCLWTLPSLQFKFK